MVAFIQNVGGVGMVAIVLVAFLIFGSKLPQMALNVGRSLFSFKKGLAEGRKELADLEREMGRRGDEE